MLLALGRLVCGVAAVLALLGLRLDRLVHHVTGVGTAVTGIDAFVPAWVAWAVPETFLGWLLLAVVFATGFCIAQGGRAIERLTH